MSQTSYRPSGLEPSSLPTDGEEAPQAAPTQKHALWRKFRMRPRDLALLLRGASVLAITGFCFAAFVMQLTRTFDLVGFVNKNEVVSRARLHMLGWLGAGAAGGVIIALVQFLLDRRSATTRAARVLRTARWCSPLLLPGLAWPLLVAKSWDALPRISGIAFLALLAEVCFRAAAGEVIAERLAAARLLARATRGMSLLFARVRPYISPEMLLVLLAAGFYAVWMSYHTILQHRQFGTSALDLGTYNTMFFNALHGHPFRCPGVLPKGGDWSMLSNHAEFTMFVLLPFYALRPGPETLLVLQAVALGIGAIPLYRLAARRLPGTAALVLTLAYLLYAPMHQANFYDIHFQPFAVVFTLWALDMLDVKRPILFAVFFVLALGCREDVPIGFAVLGLFLLLSGKRVGAGVVMTAVSVVYFVIVKFAVMPRFGNWYFSDLYKELYPPGENSYGGVVKTLLTNPVYVWKTLITTQKIVFFLLVMTPILFLPLRRGLLWMSLLPAAMFTLLTTGYGPTVEISFQYVLLYIPFVFLATALALAAYGPTKRGRAQLWGGVGGIAVATLLTSRVWGAMPPGDKFHGGFRDIPGFRPLSEADKQKARDIAQLLAMIPANASLASSELEHPHVSTRLNCYTLRVGYEGAEYILYSESGLGSEQAKKSLEKGEYEVMERRPGSGVALLRKTKP
jgi:uncharacterized membrane protein